MSCSRDKKGANSPLSFKGAIMRKLISPVLVAPFIVATLVLSLPSVTKSQTAGLVSATLTRMERNKQSL